ncbi:MAG: glycosyltransferase [Gemmatimonadales bacterium]|nr:glycosyltransferase [Gemmatimonadales bacterium]
MSASQSMIEVAHVLTSVEVGGAEQLVLQLIPAMAAHGYRGRVICLRRGGALEPAFRRAGIDVDTLPRGERGGAGMLALKLSRHLRQRRPVILHTHNNSPLLVGAAARKLAHVACHVHTKHGASTPSSLPARLGTRWAARRVDQIAVVSAATHRDAVEVDGFPPDHVTVLRNGVARVERAAPRAEPTWSAICVGRLESVKGHRYLIDAVPLIVARHPGFRLAVVGDGSERESLRAQVRALGVEQSVEFLGMRDDVQHLLPCAGMFILPSISEGVSLTLLEAMAAALPIVATAVGGTPEVVADRQSALLVAPADPPALAQAVVAFLNAPQLARELAQSARQRFDAEFSLEQMAAGYSDIYRLALSRSVA